MLLQNTPQIPIQNSWISPMNSIIHTIDAHPDVGSPKIVFCNNYDNQYKRKYEYNSHDCWNQQRYCRKATIPSIAYTNNFKKTTLSHLQLSTFSYSIHFVLYPTNHTDLLKIYCILPAPEDLQTDASSIDNWLHLQFPYLKFSWSNDKISLQKWPDLWLSFSCHSSCCHRIIPSSLI